MANKKEESKAVATVEDKNTGVTLAADLADLFMQDEGLGLEEVQNDTSLPFLSIIQALSPQINKKKEEYIVGAEQGMLFNTVTRTLYDGEMGVEIVPCFYEKVVNEWNPRNAGGGFVATHATMDEAKENSRPGTDLVDTANYYVLAKNPETEDWEPAVLSMVSTKLKVSRKWNSLMSMLKVTVNGNKITPPMHATRWLMTTVEQTNEQGTFFNFATPEYKGLATDRDLYERAKEFGEMARKRVTRPKYNAGKGEDAEDGNPSF